MGREKIKSSEFKKGCPTVLVVAPRDLLYGAPKRGRKAGHHGLGWARVEYGFGGGTVGHFPLLTSKIFALPGGGCRHCWWKLGVTLAVAEIEIR